MIADVTIAGCVRGNKEGKEGEQDEVDGVHDESDCFGKRNVKVRWKSVPPHHDRAMLK